MATQTKNSVPKGVQEQRELVKKLEADGFGWDLVVGDAFVRGMRDIGYKSTAFALAELLDNSIQADANKIDVVFGFEDGALPSQVAIVDDGYGMEPKMVRASLIWGAGTRAQNQHGFGKYGYGLPSASISQCLRVEVYSKTSGGEWYRAYLDVEEIKRGEWTKGNRIATPEGTATEPPQFVIDFLKQEGRWDAFDHGTVVVWAKLDGNRLDYKRRKELRNTLVTHLGVIYRNYLVETPMTVDGELVEPTDPLFLTEGFRYYGLDEDQAKELPPAVLPVKDKDTDEVVGTMRVRFARFPSTFFRTPKFKKTNKPGNKKGALNERLTVADENNGIIFLRNGRQIDVIRPPRRYPGAAFNATTDRFWAVEVDFDPGLDHLFSITTSKQQVRPDDSVWDMLSDKANLFRVIGEMRSAYIKEAKELAAKIEQEKREKRASIEAIEAAAKFKTKPTTKDTPQRQKEAEANLDQAAKTKAGKSGLDSDAVERELIASREGVTHEVDTEDLPGGAFFRVVQEGGTRVLYLNVAHPFYTELYQGPGGSPRLRAGLEVLLWTLGNAEVDADPDTDRRKFYERERASVWTPQLADALNELTTIAVVEDNDEEAIAA